jgi:hypothetical protein
MGPKKDSDRSKAKRKVVRTTIEVKKEIIPPATYAINSPPYRYSEVKFSATVYLIYLLCLLFLFKIICIFIVFVYDFMHEVLGFGNGLSILH